MSDYPTLEDHAVYIEQRMRDRILRGIRKLEEKLGPNWVDKVNLDTLRLSSETSCVLGQVYAGVTVTREEWDRFWAYREFTSGETMSDDDKAEYERNYRRESAGYKIGKVALNEEVFDKPWEYGFDTPRETEYSYTELTDQWKEVLAERYGLALPTETNIDL